MGKTPKMMTLLIAVSCVCGVGCGKNVQESQQTKKPVATETKTVSTQATTPKSNSTPTQTTVKKDPWAYVYDNATKDFNNKNYSGVVSELKNMYEHDIDYKDGKTMYLVAKAETEYQEWVKEGKPMETPPLYTAGEMAAKDYIKIDQNTAGNFKAQMEELKNGLPLSYINEAKDTQQKENDAKTYLASHSPVENSPTPKIGMTADQVRSTIWGNPSDVNKTVTAFGTSEQWVYGGGRYVYLENGVVTSIQE